MQNVTRTMTEYEVTAYSVCESDGEVGLNVVAECTVHSTTMNKGEGPCGPDGGHGNCRPPRMHGGLEAGKDHEVRHAPRQVLGRKHCYRGKGVPE